MGDFKPTGTPKESERTSIDPADMLSAVEESCKIAKEDICGRANGRRLVEAREILILDVERA